MEIKFVADNNVGKLARWLRLIGYDTVLFKQKDDAQMIKIALGDNRVILTTRSSGSRSSGDSEFRLRFQTFLTLS